MALSDGKPLLRIARLKTGSSGSRGFSFDVTLLAAKGRRKQESRPVSLCIKHYYKDKQHVDKFAPFKIARYLRKLITCNAPARSLLMMKPFCDVAIIKRMSDLRRSFGLVFSFSRLAVYFNW